MRIAGLDRRNQRRPRGIGKNDRRNVLAEHARDIRAPVRTQASRRHPRRVESDSWKTLAACEPPPQGRRGSIDRQRAFGVNNVAEQLINVGTGMGCNVEALGENRDCKNNGVTLKGDAPP